MAMILLTHIQYVSPGVSDPFQHINIPHLVCMLVALQLDLAHVLTELQFPFSGLFPVCQDHFEL